MPEARPLSEIKRDASLLLLNSGPITSWPRQLPPSVLPIGALHTKPAKQLPEVSFIILNKHQQSDRLLVTHPTTEFEIEVCILLSSFVDGAKEGFVIFTLGSIVKMSSMPKKTLQVFINTF